MARSGSKRFRRIFWLTTLLVLVVAGVAATFYVLYLDHLVTKQFEGRRWTLPAQVYAAPLELYAGLTLSGSDLERELQRLQYRRVDRLEHPGTYRMQGTRIDVALRAARLADETRPASIISLVANDKAIESIRDSDGKDVPIVRLEPLLIGSIFPIHGEDRIVVTPQEVPALLPQALTTVEVR
jgi:penicillin-binding protein 1B